MVCRRILTGFREECSQDSRNDSKQDPEKDSFWNDKHFSFNSEKDPLKIRKRTLDIWRGIHFRVMKGSFPGSGKGSSNNLENSFLKIQYWFRSESGEGSVYEMNSIRI